MYNALNLIILFIVSHVVCWCVCEYECVCVWMVYGTVGLQPILPTGYNTIQPVRKDLLIGPTEQLHSWHSGVSIHQHEDSFNDFL